MLGHRKLDPADYLAILRRRWWIIVVPAVIMTLIGFGATKVIPPEYLSRTLVIIENQKVSTDYVKPVVSDDLDSRLSSMEQQILSRSRLEPIVQRYDLYVKQHLTPDEKIETIRKKIEVKPVSSSIPGARGLPGFTISFKYSDAHTAALVCGDITSLFITESGKASDAAAQGTTDFLKNQLDEAKRSLDEQDAKLAEFQRQYVGKLPGEEGTNVSMLGSVNTQLAGVTDQVQRLEQEKAYEEANLAQAQANASAANSAANANVPLAISASGGPSPDQMKLTALEQQEQDMLLHYTPDYPDVVQIRKKIADLRADIAKNPAPTSAAQQAQAAQTHNEANTQPLQAQIRAIQIGIDEKKRQQAQLQSTLATYQDRISSSPLIQEQYKELTRDYNTQLAAYTQLLAEMNRAKQANDLERRQEGEQMVIMDQPNVPDTPTFPDPVKFTAGGLILGLIFGVAIIAMLEYRDTALSTERDVWEFTRLPTLAVIGYLPVGQPTQPAEKRGLLSRLNPFSRKQQVEQVVANETAK